MANEKPQSHDFTEHTLDSREAYHGRMLRVFEDRVRLPGGAEARREFVRHPGAVIIVPFLDADTFVMERQFRYPHHRHFIEFPAGKLEAGEPPLETGKRELLEETGYVAAEWEHLATTHPCIGYSNEVIELYAARGLRFVGHEGHEGREVREGPGHHERDAGEFLEVLTMRRAQILDAIQSAEITDTKTVWAMLWVEQFCRHGT